MHIGLVIYGDLDTMTGGYLYDRIMVEGLRERGHEVEVISLPSGSYLRRLLTNFSPGMCRRLLAGNFDVLIEDELCHPSLCWLNRRLRRADTPPLVALVHHALCREPRQHWQNMLLAVVERLFLASVDGLIVNSRSTERSVASLVGNRYPRVIAYPSGDRFGTPLSEEAINRRAQQPGALELLFLGNVVPRKGLLPLIRALSLVDRHLWKLSVVGGLDFDAAHVARVQRLIRQHDLADSVRFLGPLRDDKLIAILSSSQVFCMPYAYEGFGIAILEAMAFGLPAIGCQNGAASETIRHGINGFLLSPGDHAGLAPRLASLHQDREKLQELSLAARATFVSRPGWKESIGIIETFLQQMTGKPVPGNPAGAPGGTPDSGQGELDARG